MCNFHPAFIKGTTNVRTSTFKKHVATSMHERAMGLFKKQQSSSVCEYALIAAALLQPSMDKATCTWTKRKFDVAYMTAKENLPFTKMKVVWKVVWWKLFNAVDAKKWSNVLVVIELLFCLPIANGRVERVFSQMKLIKNSRRTCLGEDTCTLDQLLRINVEAPPPL